MTVAGVCKAVSFVGSGAGLTGVKMASAFDIAHWKKKNTRIRHVIAEGPEAGIYIRGKVKGNVIDLPEYWDGLVDPETITVTLTAFGRAQNLYVKEIQYGRRVIIANEDGSMPDCHYEVWVARWRPQIQEIIVKNYTSLTKVRHLMIILVILEIS